MGQVSLHEVGEGLARTRVSAETSAATDPDRHAIDLGTAEHERVGAPLISKLSVLHGHRTTAHTKLLECQARVAAIEAQGRSPAAALAAEKHRHASFLSGLSDQPPASANTATLVAHPAPQPTTLGTPTVPTVAAVTRSSGSTAPPQPGFWHPLSAHFRHDTLATVSPPRVPRHFNPHTLVGRGTPPTPTTPTTHNTDCSLPRATGLQIHVP